MRPLAAAVLATLTLLTPAAAQAADPGEGGIDDATVIAVIDSGFNPYHWDFLASKMPQQLDADPANDLPLDRPAEEWLPGFDRGAFATLERLDLTLEQDEPSARVADLAAEDTERRAAVRRSTATERNGVWLPGTKVVAAMDFGATPGLYGGPSAHGTGTSSSAVGNLHGTCPECLVVLIRYGDRAGAEAAAEWAEAQPWIDLISNSYGFGSNDTYGRDRIYAGSDTAKQKAASERGQTIFFSSGNGVENAFVVPNQTTFSSQEGPDWIMTVGAVAPPRGNAGGGAFVGAGKPVDLAGVGSDYRNAYTSAFVGRTGTTGFGGTSNATPQVAGLYARSLQLARTTLAGPSRTQSGGVVATGTPVACGPANPACELGDGVLTAGELRTRLLHGARHYAGTTVSGQGLADPSAPEVGEEVLMGEGHGAYFGRARGPADTAWRDEAERDLMGPLTGAAAPRVRPSGEREWFVVDSFCRQRNWGAWGGGAYVEGTTTLPGTSPNAPVRSARERTCPGGPTGLPRP